jgi:hypothetical protein
MTHVSFTAAFCAGGSEFGVSAGTPVLKATFTWSDRLPRVFHVQSPGDRARLQSQWEVVGVVPGRFPYMAH